MKYSMCWLMLVGSGFGQLVPYPAWSSAPLPGTYAQALQLESPNTAPFTGPFRLSPLLPRIGWDRWSFSFTPTHGVIAIDEWVATSGGGENDTPRGGLQTAFTEISHLSVHVAPARYAPATHLLLWTGKRSNGLWGVQWLPLIPGADPATWLGIDGGECSVGDEIWVTSGLVDDHLYVLDARNARVHRIVASTATGPYDQRDPGFSVTIPSDFRFPILDFFKSAEFRVEFRGIAPTERVGINDLGSIESLPVSSLDLGRPSLVAKPTAGSSTIALAGAPGRVVYVETAPSATAPWVSLSGKTTCATPPAITEIPLHTALVEGALIRVLSASGGIELEATVGPSAPTIFDVTPKDRLRKLVAGSNVTVLGSGFGTSPTARIVHVGPGNAGASPIVINQSSETRIKFTLPSTPGPAVLEVVTAAGTAQFKVVVAAPAQDH